MHVPGRLWNNPIGPASFERMLDLLAPHHDELVLEVGCGGGETLRRIVERSGCRVIGVDPDGAEIAEAERRLADHRDRVRLEQCGIGDVRVDESVDIGICIGASHAYGGPGEAYVPMLRDLKSRLAPGGRLLIGEGYWRGPPDPAYLAATGIDPRELDGHAANAERAAAEGLQLSAAVTSSEQEWDLFESTHWAAVDAQLAATPHDEAVVERARRSRAWREAYLRWGRATMGFALYLFTTS